MIKMQTNLNTKLLKSAITTKSERVLFKLGAYSLKTMQRSIRPAKKFPKFYKTTVGSTDVLVPPVGKVITAKTKQPVTKKLADAARKQVGAKLKAERDGKPPRRGKMDLLRNTMKFTVDKKNFEMTCGPTVFRKQPKLVGVADVPELLERGGKELVYKSQNNYADYGKHPFILPALDKSKLKMEQLIESEQLRP